MGFVDKYGLRDESVCIYVVRKTNARLSYLKCIKFFSGQKYSQHFSRCKKGILAIFISTTIQSIVYLRKFKWYVEKSDRPERIQNIYHILPVRQVGRSAQAPKASKPAT